MRLELLGLKAAVARLCEELSNRHDVTMHLHVEKIPEAVPREISLCLYRVLQEALQNVLKHRVSRRAHVSLSGQINTINLTVKDSGPGFDPHEAMRGPGLGLVDAKRRVLTGTRASPPASAFKWGVAHAQNLSLDFGDGGKERRPCATGAGNEGAAKCLV